MSQKLISTVKKIDIIHYLIDYTDDVFKRKYYYYIFYVYVYYKA